ncbi:MAG: thioredoxin [Pseudomonadota bacterium]
MKTGQVGGMGAARAVSLWALVAFACAFGARATAEEGAVLVMFDEDHCPYCERWHAEIGVVYAKTAEGKRAPLRQVDVHGPLPSDLPGLEPARFSPVFVLWQGGREWGRILGYPGEDFFWPMLDELLSQLDSQT